MKQTIRQALEQLANDTKDWSDEDKRDTGTQLLKGVSIETIRAVPGKSVVQLVDASGEVVAETTDSTLQYLASHGEPLTIQNYIALNWVTERQPCELSSLEAEERAEVEGLVERGFLVDIKSEITN